MLLRRAADWEAASATRPFRERALLILWPAFLMAGVLEGLVFVVVDPQGMHGLPVGSLGWSASAIYSVSFMVFWGVIATSTAITQLLEAPGPAPSRPETDA